MERDDDQTCKIIDGKIKCPVFSSPRKLYTPADLKIRKHDGNPEISIGRDPDVNKAVEDAVNGLGGMCKHVKKGDLVGIKINITGGVSTNPGSYTSPEVTRKVVEMVKECGGTPIAFDSSMIWTDMEPIAEKEGWYDWGKQNDVNVVDLHHMPVIPFDFGRDGMMEVDKASRLIKDIDVLINIPKMKSHMLTTVSMGIKNSYGLLPRADKGVYHAKDIDHVISEVNVAFPSTLTIVDGMTAGEGEGGPLAPDPVSGYNTIIASNDVACADAVAARFMGYENPLKIRHINISTAIGAGDGKCLEHPDVKKKVEATIGTHPKDGYFAKPDPRVIENLNALTKTMAAMPGGPSFMSNASDMFLKNFSYYGTGIFKNILKAATILSRRYIGKDLSRYNPNGLNLHPEDALDSAIY